MTRLHKSPACGTLPTPALTRSQTRSEAAVGPRPYRGGVVITTDKAQSALILMSVIASKLQSGEPYTVDPADLPWIMVILELMPKMPLADER
jgi:hypothetical protein